MTFSRYAGPGSHRYPVGFSGDSVDLLGVPGLPARVHRDGLQHRLRLVEPRHRWSLLRPPGRRAGPALAPARGLLADPATALFAKSVPAQGTLDVLRRHRASHGQRVALPAPAGPLPAHHEPPSRSRRASRSCGRCTTSHLTQQRRTTCRTSSSSAPSSWSRRSRARATPSRCMGRVRASAARGDLGRHLHRRRLRRRSRTLAAPGATARSRPC